MKVLVTGSSGQLGSVTVKHLLASGYDVCGADLYPSATTTHIIDIKDSSNINLLLKGFDAVIHTAALHGSHYDLNYSRHNFIDTYILGTLNLLNACVKNNISKFLYTSTTSIYGSAMVDHEKAVWVDELLSEKPRDASAWPKQNIINKNRVRVPM